MALVGLARENRGLLRLAAGQEPLSLRGDRVVVRWAPGLGEQGLMPLERYLADRLDLLDGA